MPLQADFAEDFVQVKVVNLDSGSDYVTDTGAVSADWREELKDGFNNVIGIEVENYSVPLQSLSQFTDNNFIDFELRNPSIFGGNWKQFTVELVLKPVVYNTPEAPAADLLTMLYEAFADVILKDPDFGSKVDIVAVPDTQLTTRLLLRTLAFPPLGTWPGFGSTEGRFLFASGPNAAKSAATVLGFDPIDYTFFDVTIDATPFKIAVSPRPALLNKFRYIDLFIDEVPEFKPFHRIYLPTVQSVVNALPENGSRMRLLTKPIRNLTHLTVRMRLQGDIVPFTTQNFYLSLRVFTLKSSFSLPDNEKERVKLV